MSPVGMALSALVLPCVVAALALVLTRWVGRRAGLEGSDRTAVALAVGVGYLAGQTAIAWPGFPPIDVTDRIPWIAAIATVLAVLESAWPGPAWTRWENRLLLTAVVLVTILGPKLEEVIGTRPGRVWLAGLSLAALISWTNLEALSSRVSAGRLGVALGVIAFGAAATLVLSGSLVLGQLGAALAAALIATVLLNLKAPVLSGGVPVLVATLGALLLDGFVYAGLPVSASIVLLVVPGVLWIARVGPVQRLASWQASLIAAAVALVPVGVAIAFAVAASPSYEE